MNEAGPDTDLTVNARDQLIGDLQTLTTHAQELVQATRLLTEDAVALARVRLEQSLAAAREKLAQLPKAVERRSQTAVAEFDAQLVAHPRESIAAAALVSLALGWLSRGAASGGLKHFARATAVGVAGLAGSILWSYRLRSKPSLPAAPPEEVGRWESEGGSVASTEAP